MSKEQTQHLDYSLDYWAPPQSRACPPVLALVNAPVVLAAHDQYGHDLNRVHDRLVHVHNLKLSQ